MPPNVDPSAEALTQAKRSLDGVAARGGVAGRRPKFLYFQLCDALRLASVARSTADRGMMTDPFTAEAVEVMVRRVLEQAILCEYVAASVGTEVIDRFLKTSALEFERSWKEEHETEDKDLAVKRLPDYRGMAELVDATLYDAYQRLSYLSHPRGALPHSLVEHEYVTNQGITDREFYSRRCGSVLATMAQALTRVTDAFEREVAAYGSGPSPSA